MNRIDKQYYFVRQYVENKVKSFLEQNNCLDQFDEIIDKSNRVCGLDSINYLTNQTVEVVAKVLHIDIEKVADRFREHYFANDKLKKSDE